MIKLSITQVAKIIGPIWSAVYIVAGFYWFMSLIYIIFHIIPEVYF